VGGANSLFMMILLSPVILLDFILSALNLRAGGFQSFGRDLLLPIGV
jgi:hypothetical protein